MLFARHRGEGWIQTGILLYLLIYVVIYGIWLRKKQRKEQLLWTLLFVYICLVVDLTQFPFPLGASARQHVIDEHRFKYNLVPLKTLVASLNDGFHLSNLIENMLNVIVFMPFGFIVGWLLKGKRGSFTKALIYSFLFTLAIESIQLITSYLSLNVRIFDVDDLIMNTLGGILGYLMYKLIKKIKAVKN